VKIAVVGFGSVGQGLATILRDKRREIAELQGADIEIAAVVTRSRGSLYHPNGLDPAELLNAVARGGLNAYPDRPGLQRGLSAEETAALSTIDVLVEVSPTNLQTAQPALGLCYTALSHRKHVVLANKGPVALDYVNLMARARQVNRRVLFEGTVMSGTPSLRLALEALAGCTISRVRGIVNGTTNYMLTQMEQGRPYADVLAEAQRLGYAEADPTADVDGWDAAGKLLILANALFGRMYTMSEFTVQGIRGLTPDDLAQAAAEGLRWKLIAEATAEGGSVRPVKLPSSHPLSGVSGSSNAIAFTTDLVGDITLVGPGAGGIQTGFAVLSDLLAISRIRS